MAVNFPDIYNNSSPGSTTTYALGVGGTFTGLFENVSNYAAINLTIFTDQDSATNGLEFQWSGDGINVDRSEGSNVKANTGRAFSVCPRAKYFRIKYTNGSIAQTICRLNVTFRAQGTGLIARPLNQSLTLDNFAQSVRSAASAEDVDNLGTFQFLQSKNNRLLVATDQSQLAEDNKFFVTSVEKSSISTIESPVLLFTNPSGSNKTVKIYRIITSNFHTVSSIIKYRLYKSPTITTNGTGLNEVSTHIGSSATASSTLFVSPTLSANGTLMSHWLSAAMSTSAIVVPFEGELILDANTSFAITAQADGTSRIAAVTIVWAEI